MKLSATSPFEGFGVGAPSIKALGVVGDTLALPVTWKRAGLCAVVELPAPSSAVTRTSAESLAVLGSVQAREPLLVTPEAAETHGPLAPCSE